MKVWMILGFCLLFISCKQKVDSREDYNVLFVGGSITKGTGASSYKKSWVGLLSNYLSETYDDLNFSFKNIAIGGTTSRYAVYRFERDIGKFKPDLVYIEFAVNDPEDEIFIKKYTLGLINKIRELNPEVKITYIITTDRRRAKEYQAGITPVSTEVIMDIAKNNGLDVIDVGRYLVNNIQGENVTDYLPDNVHPNDYGHSLYFEAIKRNQKFKRMKHAPKTIENNLLSANIISPKKVKTDSCFFKAEVMSCGENSSFKIEGYFNSFGLEKIMAQSGLELACRDRKGSVATTKFSDKYSTKRARVLEDVMFNFNDADFKEISCKVYGDKHIKKKGRVLIKGILIS